MLPYCCTNNANKSRVSLSSTFVNCYFLFRYLHSSLHLAELSASEHTTPYKSLFMTPTTSRARCAIVESTATMHAQNNASSQIKRGSCWKCCLGWQAISLRYLYNSRLGQHFNWYRASREYLGNNWTSFYLPHLHLAPRWEWCYRTRDDS